MKAAASFAIGLIALGALCAWTNVGPSLGLGALYLVVAVLP